LQFGEQRGGPQVFVAPVHTNEEQLPLSEQAAPGAQCGEQAGG
jgi:hypothetical protein